MESILIKVEELDERLNKYPIVLVADWGVDFVKNSLK